MGNESANKILPLQRLALSEVLYFFDYPLMFVERSEGQAYLFIAVDSTDDCRIANIYVAAEIAEDELENLLGNTLECRAPFMSNPCWVVRVSDDLLSVVNSEYVEPGMLPEAYLPAEGSFLKPIDTSKKTPM